MPPSPPFTYQLTPQLPDVCTGACLEKHKLCLKAKTAAIFWCYQAELLDLWDEIIFEFYQFWDLHRFSLFWTFVWMNLSSLPKVLKLHQTTNSVPRFMSNFPNIFTVGSLLRGHFGHLQRWVCARLKVARQVVALFYFVPSNLRAKLARLKVAESWEVTAVLLEISLKGSLNTNYKAACT